MMMMMTAGRAKDTNRTLAAKHKNRVMRRAWGVSAGPRLAPGLLLLHSHTKRQHVRQVKQLNTLRQTPYAAHKRRANTNKYLCCWRQFKLIAPPEGGRQTDIARRRQGTNTHTHIHTHIYTRWMRERNERQRSTRQNMATARHTRITGERK